MCGGLIETVLDFVVDAGYTLWVSMCNVVIVLYSVTNYSMSMSDHRQRFTKGLVNLNNTHVFDNIKYFIYYYRFIYEWILFSDQSFINNLLKIVR